MLTSAEHKAIRTEAKRRRNAFRRAVRNAPVHLLRVPVNGETLLVAVSRTEPLRGYWLRPGSDGRLVCDCWRFTRYADCAHVQAAMQRSAAEAPHQEGVTAHAGL